jgi:hypothetical protein
LNLNYVAIVKYDIDKLLATRFIQFIKEATWLLPIVVVFKKNGKLKICVDFKKLNKATKTNPYPLPFSNEVLNTITRYEVIGWIPRILSNFFSP